MLKPMLAIVAVLATGGGLAAWAGVLAEPAPAVADAVDPIGALIAATPAETCESAIEFSAAASDNAASLTRLSWAPFGRAEKGWEIYAPTIAHEIGTPCAPGSVGFARDLADWQARHAQTADGRMGAGAFLAMKTDWQSARPFVAVRAEGICPNAPSDAELTRLDASEGYGGKAIDLRSDTARAYRAMVAAARAEDPAIAANLEAMQIFSGYRSPSYDAARCARDGNCGGITRASCSSHRTGETFDLVVGHAPGHSVDSTNDQNRLFMSRTPEYLWLVANAERFGFVNYVFEPWHWEYVGQSRLQAAEAP